MRALDRMAVVGLLCCALAAVALAEPPQPPRQRQAPVFSVHDLDRDGYIDRREYYHFGQRLRARRGPRRYGFQPLEFEQIDRDADGRISQEEMIERIGRGRGAALAHPPRGGR